METKKPADTQEPKIEKEEILLLKDHNFNTHNVCLVTGAGTGIGRATAFAAEEIVSDVMMGMSRIKEMMSPIEVANLFVFGFSRFARYLIGGDLLFDGGVVKTY